MEQLYISVTGLRLKRFWHAPRFWRLAVRAMAEAKSAPGNLRASARSVRGVHHTLSVWEGEDAMRAYLRSPEHARAMRAFAQIATGRTLGYHADTAPDWAEALSRWKADARSV
ncbi:MAG: hypothetical protein QNJ13_10505 [Paracoccaceae bacterium]|nr:hypothetical protein [Paracoccaceae bacterium]